MADTDKLMTVGQISKSRGVPGWRVRQLIDQLDPGCSRAGLYRVVSAKLLRRIDGELARRAHHGSQTREATGPVEK